MLSVVGARPNFMKLAPVARALASRGVRHLVAHTGQHYDRDMSDAFFRDLLLAAPDYALDVGSASHARQTAAIMERLEPVMLETQPDVVLVYGDVNSTAAAALVAAKLGVTVGHVEAGLRSGDRSMPEEINRIVTDHCSDLLFAPSRDAVANLEREGRPSDAIQFVGNVMIDTLRTALPAARACAAARRHGVLPGQYTVATLHRPANVDAPETLRELLSALAAVSVQDGAPVLFPVHPRTRARIRDMGAAQQGAHGGVRLLDPLPYLEMLSLTSDAALVLTDSGGLQEETTWLGVPCVTVRPNTERPITCTAGTNRLAAPTVAAIRDAAGEARARRPASPPVIERWDGCAGERIAAVLQDRERFG